jgi:hypothetical protein
MEKIIRSIKTFRHPALPVLEPTDWEKVERHREIRLLSYNLFLRPVVKNVDNDWKDERLEAFVST